MRCARTRRELLTSTSWSSATGLRSKHRPPTHRRIGSAWSGSRTATTRTISSASTATYLPLRHHVSGRGPVLGPPETFRAVFHLPGTILFTEVRGRGILGSSDSGSCIDLAPRGARIASGATYVAWEGTTYCGAA